MLKTNWAIKRNNNNLERTLKKYNTILIIWVAEEETFTFCVRMIRGTRIYIYKYIYIYIYYLVQ